MPTQPVLFRTYGPDPALADRPDAEQLARSPGGDDCCRAGPALPAGLDCYSGRRPSHPGKRHARGRRGLFLHLERARK
jgi:hypothetical protein